MEQTALFKDIRTNYPPATRLWDAKAHGEPELTVLSFGAGQDSTAMLYLLAFSKEFRDKYAPNRLLIIFADTMDEHPQTYEHVEEVKDFCLEQGMEFVHVSPEMGFHGWEGLREFYRRTVTVGSKAFRSKACTGNLKIKPIYDYLESFVGREYNFPTGRKAALKCFGTKFGKIRVLVGIARGEEKRMADPAEETQKWKRDSIEVVYPLIDLGMDRGDCQRSIAAFGKKVPVPSNCVFCHYLSERELLWLFRFMPKDYSEWVEIERAKIERFSAVISDKPNHGVWRNKTLPQVLAEAVEKYGHYSDEELWEHKQNHGHCVQSKY